MKKNHTLKPFFHQFQFFILLVTCPKFVYSAPLQIGLKWVNFHVFGPYWTMSKCAQMSYLIHQTLQNSGQPNTILFKGS